MARRKWTPEGIIAAIQARQRQGLPMTTVCRENTSLYAAAFREFGSWYGALRAAGIQPFRKAWTKEDVLTAIQAYQPPTDLRRGESLVMAARKFFGSWHAAVTAAGLTPTKPRRSWSTQSVLEEIQARHRQGLSLTQQANPTLASVAAHRFGNWNNALLAAGIEPKKRFSHWSKERVLLELNDLQQQDGGRPIAFPKVRHLAHAARQHFGSWNAAMVEAGILQPYEKRWRRDHWTPQQVITAIQDCAVRGVRASDDPRLMRAARRHFGSLPAAQQAAGIRSAIPCSHGNRETP